jgi:23S rRNA (guanosine2251-2'-O)-methyltransferase
MIDIFHEKGYTVIAADKTDDAVPVYDTAVTRPLLLVVGGEKRGITRTVLEKCDKVVSLDYGRRFGAALSAASAASILAFEIYRQNRSDEGNA